MIESRYWKEELIRIARSLRPVARPRRWSERSVCLVERDLMIGFFIIRRLIELRKVSSRVSDWKLTVSAYQALGLEVTLLNRDSIWDLYDMSQPARQTKSALYVSNQFIHAYMSFIVRDANRNWSDVLVVSDLDRNRCLWQVSIRDVRELLLAAAQDYPHSVSLTFDPVSRDYRVVTN